jgi:chromosome segregation ATPase/ActR/RegA family two-component response regulator
MGQRLLLVDSDRSFLKEHQVSLEAAFDLEVAASTDRVISRLESGAFAAAFICVEVAENKGYALCSAIRKNAKLDGLKVVLISAKATDEEYRRHQSLKGKADLYLHKPIAPSALVAALTPLVPGRVLDPDNPLGELVDAELGDDWLDGLKNSLDNAPSGGSSRPAPGARLPAPAPAAHRETRTETTPEVPPDSRHMRLLEDQVAALHEELRVRDQRILAAEAEAQQIQRQLNSVTLNLDELARSNREAESLKARLAETESALRLLGEGHGNGGEQAEMLKAQLKEALIERTDLIQQVETLNHQVGEKAQRAIELLKERDRLLHETMDLEPFRARVKELESALAAKEEALAQRQPELEASSQAHSQLNATLEELVARHSSLEGVHQAALLEVAGYKEKLHTSQLEMAGLEATMRGQGRDLAELGNQLRQRETELGSSQAQVLDRDQQLLAKQEIIQQLREEITQLTGQLAGVQQKLNEAKTLHESERLELMTGLDHKEGEISRLNQALTDQREAHGALEREKQAIHGQLSEHRDRLQSLNGLLQEIQDKVRRGSDLAKG